MQASRARTHGKRRRQWKGFILPVLLVLLITSAVLLFFNFNNSKQAISNEPEEIPTPVIVDTRNSEVESIQIVSEISEERKTPFTIEYPKSDNEEFNTTVQQFITAMKKEYRIESQLTKEKDKKELTTTVEIVSHATNTHSILIHSTTPTRKDNGIKRTHAFHLNPATGNQLTVKDLLDNNTNNLALVNTEIQKQLLANDELQKTIEEQLKSSQFITGWEMIEHFTLEDETITFHLNDPTFIADHNDVVHVTLNILAINDFINEDFKVEEPLVIPGPDVKTVALTFDDGPHPTITPEILSKLAKYNAKATFFMLGNRVDADPEIAKAVADAGHEIGNHSWSHPDLSRQSPETVQQEIDNTSAVIKEATGKEPTLFRPPYGSFNDMVKSKTNLPIILWDVDTLDWKHKNAAQTFSIITRNTRNGSNILMHDIHQTTSDALENALNFLQNEGYTFVTVSQLEAQLVQREELEVAPN